MTDSPNRPVQKETVSLQSPTHVLDLLPPYPIVLVTTRTNAITINQVMYFTFRPLRIGVAIAHARYTYELLKDEGEFVINVPDASLADAVKSCGSLSGRDGDKFEAIGLNAEPSRQVQAVSVAQCAAHIECRVARTIPFEHRDWFVGQVVAARKRADHTGTAALMCGRHNYSIPGNVVAPR
jgi:flavin reductase (DIM6/NTAB) family NADH-FMN oxidoreductase RutF